MSLTPPSSFPSFCPLIFPLFFFVSFHSYLFLVFPYVRYLHIQMTTTDDRDRDGNISNGSTHIMISRHSAFGSFSLIRKSVTAMLWPLWLFSVTCWLPFRHEDFFFFFFSFLKIERKKKMYIFSSAQLPAVFFMTASYKMKTKLLPRFCESMGDQILSLFCVYCSTRRSRMGVLLGCMTRLLGYFLSAVFLCYLLVRHWDKLLFYPSFCLCLVSLFIRDYAAFCLSFLLATYFSLPSIVQSCNQWYE